MADFRPHAYAVAMEKEDLYASDRSMLYRWNGLYWQCLDDNAGESVAYRWLVENDTDNAAPRNASAAHRAAVLWVPELPAEKQELIIPCQNGYLYLEGDELVLKEADKSAGLQYAISCDYRPNGRAPTRFHEFLDQVLPDKEVQARIQEYAGYTLTADARYQRAQLWLGSGANGKGVLANIIQALHGYVAAVSLDNLDGFKLSVLIGASLIYCDEIPRHKVNEQLLKSLIAGERVMVDRKYKDPLSLNVRGKWLVLGNHLPTITDHSTGFWRRWDIVPFNVTIPESQRDPLLAETIIREELSGVLNWALEGLVRLQKRGAFDAVLPKAMSQMLYEAKIETNSVSAWFIDNGITSGDADLVVKDTVYQHYAAWTTKNGMTPVSAPQFWTRLRDLATVSQSRKRQGKQLVWVCNIVLPEETDTGTPELPEQKTSGTVISLNRAA